MSKNCNLCGVQLPWVMGPDRCGNCSPGLCDREFTAKEWEREYKKLRYSVQPIMEEAARLKEELDALRACGYINDEMKRAGYVLTRCLIDAKVEQFCVLFGELKAAMKEYNDVGISERYRERSGQ